MLVGALTGAVVLALAPTVGASEDRAGSVATPRGGEAAYADGVVLVEFVPGTPASQRRDARREAGARSTQPLSPLAPDAERLELQPGRSVTGAIRALERNPNVRVAEPDHLVEPLAVPDDPRYLDGSLWGMYSPDSTPSSPHGSRAADAWAAGYTGDADVHVGVIDTGLQVGHPDLAANVAAQHGWNFYDDDDRLYWGREDDHGTHVAGTIGAVGDNGIGVVGVNWDTSMVPLKFLGPQGGFTSDAIKAVDHATSLKLDQGVNIVATNNSWGGGGFNQLLLDAIDRGGDADILFVAAAGNAGLDADETPSYPAAYECTGVDDDRDWDCVISVAATTSTGALASFSNYGWQSVDLGAPGQSILSTTYNSRYGTKSGTSMAAPHVTGALALCAAIDPDLGAQQLRDHLTASVTWSSALVGKTVTGGRLDVGTLAARCAVDTPLEITTTGLPAATVGEAYEADLQATGGRAPYGWSAAGLPDGLELTGSTITGVPETAGDVDVELVVTDEDGTSETATLTLSVVEPPPPPDLEVAGIAVETSGNRWLRGSAVVEVQDGGTPAAGASVTGRWTFSSSTWQSTQTETTDAVGHAAFDSGNPKLTGGTYDFCVTSLSHDGTVVTYAEPVCSGDVGTPSDPGDPDDPGDPGDPEDPPSDPDPGDSPVLIDGQASGGSGGTWNASVSFRIHPDYPGPGTQVAYEYVSQRGDVSGGGTCTPGTDCMFDVSLRNRDAHVTVTAWVTGDRDDTETALQIDRP